MNRSIFEGRFLVNMVGSIIRQDNLRPQSGRLDWGQMYRIADYHRIANVVYLGFLGNGVQMAEMWKERFFNRYQETLRFGDICTDAEKEILMMLDMRHVPCIILASCGIRSLYQIPETAANSPLSLFLSPESYALAKGYLIDLGYETDRIYTGYGERMRRVSGFIVELYQKLPFETRLYKKNMQYIMEHTFMKNSYNYIRVMSAEDRFIYRMAQAVYHYVTDELLIRELLDLYLYHRAWSEHMKQEYINKRLTDFKIQELAGKLLYISYMWFGSKEDSKIPAHHDDMEVYDILENRILSNGIISKETDPQAIELARLIRREMDKGKRREKIDSFKRSMGKQWKEFARKMRWIFPEYKYMCAMYPWLENIPILLPVGWMLRGVRMIFRLIFRKHNKSSED